MKNIFHIVLLKEGFLYIVFYIGILLAFMAPSDVMKAQDIPKAIDRANMDTTVSPCDDFWQFANGNWLKSKTIPAEYSMWSTWQETIKRTNTVLLDILERAARKSTAPRGTPEQKIGDFYRIAMDTVKIEADRAKPLEAEIDFISSLFTPLDIQKAIIRYHKMGIPILFDVNAGADMKNPDTQIAYFSQGRLGMPDRDYYMQDDAEALALRNAYMRHIRNIFKLLGDNDVAAMSDAKRVMAFETRLAQNSMKNAELRDPSISYLVKTITQANEMTPNFSWILYFKGVGLDQVDSFSLSPDKYFTEMNTMLTDVPIVDWKAYFRWQIVHFAASYLSSDFVNEDFHFYKTILQGTKQIRVRWKRVLQSTEGPLGEILGQLYVEQAFTSLAKEKVLDMVHNLLASMRDRIQAVDWMSDLTKQIALKKLASITPKIGYPDKWNDYSTLEISPDNSYLENIMRCRAFERRHLLNKVGKPIDRTEWEMSPQSTDAYYNPLANEIAFPAGILQPPFFDPNADDASNYGAIGTVIGHEITHGFDDMGSQFGPTGTLENWWTDADRKKFESRTAQLVEQFDQYVVVDSQSINGKLTLGENIADLGGLNIAYYALQKTMQGKSLQELDGLTPEQRFFISYATIWRVIMPPKVLKLWMGTMQPSPSEYRVRGPLANMPEFMKAFGCTEDAKMLRRPEYQIRIW